MPSTAGNTPSAVARITPVALGTEPRASPPGLGEDCLMRYPTILGLAGGIKLTMTRKLLES
jgi:hypothetical protein